jgi:hypothetical protein
LCPKWDRVRVDGRLCSIVTQLPRLREALPCGTLPVIMTEERSRRIHTCSFIFWPGSDCLASPLSPSAKTLHRASLKCKGTGKYRGALGRLADHCCVHYLCLLHGSVWDVFRQAVLFKEGNNHIWVVCCIINIIKQANEGGRMCQTTPW